MTKRTNPILLKYTPHGLNKDIFKPLNSEEEKSKKFLDFKQKYTRGSKFTLLFNSRNIRRKQIPDLLFAWKMFMDTLNPLEQDECTLILHTEAVSDHGTDLPAVIEYLFPYKNNIVLSTEKLDSPQMNYLYNCADGVILLSSNEGWGLSLTEALLTGTPIIANVTGGMQDQMRFEDEEGNWFTPNKNVPSNHKKTYTKHGEWAFPVFPGNNSIQGSPTTPYLYDDRCSSEDAAEKIEELYSIGDKERKRRGKLGMEWALGDEAGFTSEKMAESIIDSIDTLLENWVPRESFNFFSDSEYIPKSINHKLKY